MVPIRGVLATPKCDPGLRMICWLVTEPCVRALGTWRLEISGVRQ